MVSETLGNMSCVICMEDSDDNKEWTVLPRCSHIVHYKCMITWLTRSQSCPVCLAEVNSEEVVDSCLLPEHNHKRAEVEQENVREYEENLHNQVYDDDDDSEYNYTEYTTEDDEGDITQQQPRQQPRPQPRPRQQQQEPDDMVFIGFALCSCCDTEIPVYTNTPLVWYRQDTLTMNIRF